MDKLQTFILDHRYALGVTATLGACIWGFRRHVKGRMYRGKRRLDGKTALVTGGNTGIGKETAMDLAKRGARVIIACRDLKKAKEAVDEIFQRSGKTVRVVSLDLASLKSVRQCAEEINRTESRLDILINNAGIMACPHWKTEDGIEMQFGVNHLGHFLLTVLLLDLIKKSAPSRIVNVSSMAHMWSGPLDFDDIVTRDKKYSSTNTYAQSKMCNIFFTKELARRLEGSGVTTYCLHPGAIHTELQRHWVPSWAIFRIPAVGLYTFFTRTPFQGAQTSIFCAVDESLEKETGKYYDDCAEKTPADPAYDEAMAKKLWELSERLTASLKTGKA